MRVTPTDADPLRDLDWRWTCALDTRVGRAGDEWISAARRFRRGLEAARSAEDARRLAARMPAFAAAHALWRKDGLARAAVEARILASEPAAEIARKSGMPAAVVAAYEALFYDVRSRLAATDFVAVRVLGPIRPGDDLGAAWRFFGFVGGPLVLDEVIGGRTTTGRPAGPADVAPFLLDEAKAALGRHLVAFLRQATDTEKRALLGRAAAALVTAGRDDPAANRSNIERHILAMLTDIPWTFGADADLPGQLPPAVAAADRLAAELSADELMQLAAGEKVDGLDELPDRLPPPRKQRNASLAHPQAPPVKPPKPGRPAGSGPGQQP